MKDYKRSLTIIVAGLAENNYWEGKRMPIVDIDKSKQLEFGHGDIEVAAGLLQVEETVGTVLFWNSGVQNEIGAYHEYGENNLKTIDETPVRMVFPKAESIDVVIDALERAKQMMMAGTTKINKR